MESSRSVVTNMLDYDVVESDFEVQFNTTGKSTKIRYSPDQLRVN